MERWLRVVRSLCDAIAVGAALYLIAGKFPREYMFATLTDSFTFVQPILEADRAAAQGRAFYDDAYFAAFVQKTQPILEKRIAGAISGVASVITQAWIDAGRPTVPLETPPRAPRPIKR